MAKNSTPCTPSLLLLCFSLLTHHLLSCSSTCVFPAERDEPEAGPAAAAAAAAEVKGMFVFGSSLVDNGNNNFLQNSFARADYFPYGIDFPLGPSGRFTNGKNVIDLLGEELNLPSPGFIPAFTNPSTKGSRIIHGVDYASGASGILDDTGVLAGHVISLSEQIRNFEKVTLPDLEKQVACRSTESLPNYLFVVGTGGNDYSFNYFLRIKSNNNLTLQAFTTNLTTSLSAQLQKLYDLGARKFVLMSLYPIGCSPMAKAHQPTRNGCVQSLNVAAHLFNAQLKSMVDVMKRRMPGSNLVYVNAYNVIREIIRNPTCKGFRDSSNACCELSSVEEGGVLCKRGGSACADRSRHVFFDGLHPTEAVNKLIAKTAYSSNLKTQVYPINVQQLARAQIP